MSKKYSTRYTVFFAVLVAAVCSIFVASSVILLRPMQRDNQRFDRMRNVLRAAGLVKHDTEATRAEYEQLFKQRVLPIVVNLQTGEKVEGIDPLVFDQNAVLSDMQLSRQAPNNAARLTRLPLNGVVFQVVTDGQVEMVVIPVRGAGLWGQIYGYLALDADIRTIRGVSFNDHKETPGLGAEIENPAWTARWTGRQVADPDGKIRFEVFKGNVGTVADDPYRVDAISGATLTSQGVTQLIRFWVDDNGYGSFLKRFAAERGN